MNKKYLEIQKLIQENRSDRRIAEVLSNYHENDIAELLENLGSVKNVGVEDTPRISEPLSFFEKTLFSSAPTGVSHR